MKGRLGANFVKKTGLKLIGVLRCKLEWVGLGMFFDGFEGWDGCSVGGSHSSEMLYVVY